MSGADKSPEAYRTISEAAQEVDLPTHVLRFWETKFTQLKPVKRRGGRRMYRPQDIALIKGLRHLLYSDGFTIKGAQKYLKDHGVAHVCQCGLDGQTPSLSADTPHEPVGEDSAEGNSSPDRSQLYRQSAKDLSKLVSDLEDVKSRLDRVLAQSLEQRKAG